LDYEIFGGMVHRKRGLVIWLWLSRIDLNRTWATFKFLVDPVAKAFIEAFVHVEVGGGARALFWEDNWISGCSIKTLAPNLLGGIPLRLDAQALTLFVWLISNQPTVLFSQNKPATNNQPAYFSLGTNQHQLSVTSQTNRLTVWEGLFGDVGLQTLPTHVRFRFLFSFSTFGTQLPKHCSRQIKSDSFGSGCPVEFTPWLVLTLLSFSVV
jgi:hypothetical protein